MVTGCLMIITSRGSVAPLKGRIAQLPEHQPAQGLQIAQEWDYATPAERQETQGWNPENWGNRSDPAYTGDVECVGAIRWHSKARSQATSAHSPHSGRRPWMTKLPTHGLAEISG